jgi:hypothetical protein
MCQEAVRKLCNPSESSHVRKVVRLLARPLKEKLELDSRPEVRRLVGQCSMLLVIAGIVAGLIAA